MSSKAVGPIRSSWYKWKAQRWVPWRKRFLVGLDLHGNTFWEFRESLWSPQYRMRRIVQYPPNTHASDVDVSPQWLQWLRHTRKNAPSLTEQSQDLVRQENLKILAAQADARWAAKPSVLDAPRQAERQPLPPLRTTPGGEIAESEHKLNPGEIGREKVRTDSPGARPAADLSEGSAGNVGKTQAEQNSTAKPEGVKEKAKVDPWKQAPGASTEQWQPQSWGGTTPTPRR
ncbi:uncharacterized protein BP5553_05944 [Venustampulla echinocandica]|uniref:Uncharacterized protein n=1 Tax=Venustampulla echinocandica TaxID=2656787 RepID=A0A370TM42_9HELO|nr:uncharacterized protein BP5553_05944 [Venustampulla echinocandica]RDL36592.1 hypothetical protein BP5553_05944 [Venustampulla echinocandica]